MRRIIAVAALLMMSGVLPLIASVRLCSSHACCRNHKAQTTVSRTSCCGETCVKAPEDASATTPSSVGVPVVAQTLLSARAAGIARTTLSIAPQFLFASPPTQRRLAALSILIV